MSVQLYAEKIEERGGGWGWKVAIIDKHKNSKSKKRKYKLNKINKAICYFQLHCQFELMSWATKLLQEV